MSFSRARAKLLPLGFRGASTAFYQKCRSRMQLAVAGAKTIRAGRMAEREAIFETLEEYGLIERTRGGMPYAPKSEIIL